MSDCVVEIRIGPTVVTRVTALPPRTPDDPITRIPFPEGAWFTLEALRTLFAVTPAYLYMLLSRHSSRFTTPHLYRPRQRGRKKGGPARLERILSMHDYHVLRELMAVRVGLTPRKRKEKETPP